MLLLGEEEEVCVTDDVPVLVSVQRIGEELPAGQQGHEKASPPEQYDPAGHSTDETPSQLWPTPQTTHSAELAENDFAGLARVKQSAGEQVTAVTVAVHVPVAAELRE